MMLTELAFLCGYLKYMGKIIVRVEGMKSIRVDQIEQLFNRAQPTSESLLQIQAIPPIQPVTSRPF
jgi:hypothetical protein